MAKSTQNVLRHGENLGHTPAIRKEEIKFKCKIEMKWQPWKTYEKTYENRDKPIDITGPPCARCEYWQPRRDYMDIGKPHGKVFDGVTLCVAYDDHSIEMDSDFSCFSPRNTIEVAPMGQPPPALGELGEEEEIDPESYVTIQGLVRDIDTSDFPEDPRLDDG